MEKIIKNGNVIENTFPHADVSLENVKAKGSEVLKKAIAKGQSLWSGTESIRRKTWGQAKGLIQKHPAQAVGCAVLLGAVLAALLYRNGQD